MEMTSSIINVLRPFLWRQHLFVTLMAVLKDYNSQVCVFISCFAGSVYDLFSWLPRGGLSLQYLTLLLRPRQWWFVLLFLHQHWSSCWFIFSWHTGLGTWYSCWSWLTILMSARMHIAFALQFKLKLWSNFVSIFRYMLWYLFSAAVRESTYYVMEEFFLKTSMICSFLLDFIL
jgi:hypothetical protein